MSKLGALNGAAEVAVENKVNDESTYEIIRRVDPVDNVLKLESSLGLFSNVIIAATYQHKNNEPLSPNALFHALRIVIEQHPSLYITPLRKPDPKKKGHHLGWKGRLKSINLEECVSSLDGYDDSVPSMTALFQKIHNEWFDLEDRTRPLWRLVVVNRVRVLFVWQHLVSDGRGGIQFHQSLLAALNKISKDGSLATEASKIVTTSTKPLPTDPNILYKAKGYKADILATIFKAIWFYFFRLWIGKKAFFFSDAEYSLKVPALGQVKDSDICITSLQSLHLDAATLARIIVECKKRKVTFSAFLATLIDVTLATDVYPLAKARTINRQVDLRRYLAQNDNMVNLSSTVGRIGRVEEYRKAGHELPSNSSRFWNLVQDHNTWLRDHLSDVKHSTPIPIRDSLIPVPEDEESFVTNLISKVWLVSDRSYTISNLGMVESPSSTAEGGGDWGFSAMEFSCCGNKPVLGFLLYFGVMSLKGGECAINLSYEKGLLPDEKVKGILEKIEQRLGTVI